MIRLTIASLCIAAALSAQPGERLFLAHCAPCHGNRGDGGIGANLAVPRLLHAPDDDALASVITLGIPGTGMPPTRLTADERRDLVLFVRALGRIAPEPLPGDAALGDRVFWVDGKCGDCHAVRLRGGGIGSDLTAVGARRNPAFLRRAILEPESAVTDKLIVYRRYVTFPEGFLQVRVVTAAGRHITGARLNEDSFSIQLRAYDGRFYSFMKSELKELHKDWGKTPMPSYQGVFTPAELDNLVAFLAGLRGYQ